MPTPTDLTQRIQSLLDKRQEHTAAVAAIDETLARVSSVLKEIGSNRKIVASSSKPSTVVKTSGKGKKVRRKFAVSGEQSILNFVKSKSNPVGKEIQKHWASEGRAGAAANLISKLVKAKRLKRTPLKDERGSHYSLA